MQVLRPLACANKYCCSLWIFIIRKNKTVTFSFLTKCNLNIHIHIPVLLHILSQKTDKKMPILLLSTFGLDLYFIGLSLGIVKCSNMCGYEVLRHITSCGEILLFYINYYHTGVFRRRLSHSQRF